MPLSLVTLVLGFNSSIMVTHLLLLLLLAVRQAVEADLVALVL